MKVRISLLALGYCVFIALSATLALYNSAAIIQNLRSSQLEAISQPATRAHFGIKGLQLLTLFLIPDLEFAAQTTTLAANNRPLLLWLDQLVKEPLQPTESALPVVVTQTALLDFAKLATSCQKTWWVKNHWLCQQLPPLSKLVEELTPFIIDHLEQPHTYIILFQNSEELRASGGFMGSFAKVTTSGRGIESIEVEDIYEIDGQFQGFVPAPPGVAEYLSSGNGLRLPDANWAADFPTAAQTILSYFSLSNQQNLDGVIAINSSLIEKMLSITGDIYIPDYQTNISAETFTTLARADREAFFPGSKQKQHFLAAFLTQIKLRLSELSPSQQQALLELLATSAATKDILAFSTDPDLQQFLVEQNLAGQLTIAPQSNDYLYLVESNVGIAKSNKYVSRQVLFDRQASQATLTINFTHTTPQVDDYINYQRILIPESWQVTQIVVGNQTLSQTPAEWDRQLLPIAGASMQQIGFLVGVKAGTQQTIQIQLATPALASTPLTNNYQLQLSKQPGLAPTPYTITWLDQSQTILLDQDTQVFFSL